MFDNVGNASPVAAGSVTLAAVDGVDHPDTATDEDTAEAALMRDWGVTADEAAARVDRQASIEAMDDYLTTNNPDTYGGLWVDEANGGAVKVATTQPGITAGLAVVATGVTLLFVDERVCREHHERLHRIHLDHPWPLPALLASRSPSG